jgi:hypothetical protein
MKQIGKVLVMLVLAGHSSAYAKQPSVDEKWDFAHSSIWRVSKDVIHANVGRRANTRAIIRVEPACDVLIQTEVRFSKDSPRNNFGVVLRAEGERHLALRYYDRPRALELLQFHGSDWKPVGKRSAAIEVGADRWYTLKAAAVGSTVLAKLWPSGEDEPNWQLRVSVDRAQTGRHGLLVHDAGKFEFRNFHLSTDTLALHRLQKESEVQRQARLKELRASLRLAVVPESFPRDNGKTRVVEVVPFAHADRLPLAGTLTWIVNDQVYQRKVTTDNYDDKALTIEVPEPSQRVKVNFALKTPGGIELKSNTLIDPAELKPWRHYVKRSIDTLIEHGRDDYGPTKTPLIMAVLDTATLQSPRNPDRLDASVRLEGRIHRRGEQGSNLWYDQALIKAMRRLSHVASDEKYNKAADDYITHYLANCNKRQDSRSRYHTGMPAWGTHIYWSCYEERPAGDQGGSGPHEILLFRANWQDMYRLAPQAVRRIADDVWTHHIVDKHTGQHNRHDDGRPGCDFAFSGGSFLHLFATMHKVTGNSHYLDKARTVADWHWKNRNKKTNLPADCPGLKRRYDGNHVFTTVSGPHAMLLLEAYRASGDEYFRDIASTYVKAYDKFAWDDQVKSYYAMLTLDGKPLPDREKGEGYGAYAPYGHVNVWRTTFYSYEFTLSAAQSAILAYELSGNSKAERDGELLAIAKRWASVIQRAMPAQTGRRWKNELEQAMPRAKETGGAYAEDYGRAVSFFVHLHRATGEKPYLDLANTLAEDAVRKLFHNGLFKGHAAKPYYETTNGVGLLLFALLELDAPNEPLSGAM